MSTRVILVMLLAGCVTTSQQTGLRHRFPESEIQQFSAADRAPVASARAEYRSASQFLRSARAYADQAADAESNSKKQLKGRQADLLSAEAALLRAERDGKPAKVNYAKGQQRLAELHLQNANARADFTSKQKRFAIVWLGFAKATLYAAEASYEASKAELAQRKGLYPSGLVYDDFYYQRKTRIETARQERTQTHEARREMTEAKDKWQELIKTATSEGYKLGMDRAVLPIPRSPASLKLVPANETVAPDRSTGTVTIE